jgi:allantoinase
MSSAESLPAIQKFRCDKKKGKNLTIETSHHYLNFMSEEIGDCRTEFKTSPPIRNSGNKRKLWEAIKSYEIDMVSSNHTPSTTGSKCLIYGKNRGNFLGAVDGIASIQFGLPAFWTNCESNGLNLYDVNRFLSLNPAKFLGFEKNKGSIAVGMDADFCIWDPAEEFEVTKDDILFMNKISPYIGKKLKGKVHATVVRGYIVYEAKNPTFDKPVGDILLKRNVRREKKRIQFSDFDDEVPE